VEGSCEYGNEPLASIKCWEVHELLNNWQHLKRAHLHVVSNRNYRSLIFVRSNGTQFVGVESHGIHVCSGSAFAVLYVCVCLIFRCSMYLV
jgi:hypothetical protein